ncbi:MAG: LuxR C-terminal-related transcriptional regulator [Cyclobacteriaceae bacterium]
MAIFPKYFAKLSFTSDQKNMLYHLVGASSEAAITSRSVVPEKSITTREVAPEVFSIGPHFVYIVDHNLGVITQVGQAFTDILGYDAQVLLKTGVDFFYQITHPDDKSQMMKDNELAWLIAKRLKPETRKKIRMSSSSRFRRKDGSYLSILNQSKIIQTDENGEILLTLNVCTDTSNWQRKDGQSFSVDLQEDQNAFVRLTNEQHNPALFSRREKDVLRLLVNGHNSKSISDKLSISYHTVNTHRKNMLRKINFKNTSELIAYAITNGLI